MYHEVGLLEPQTSTESTQNLTKPMGFLAEKCMDYGVQQSYGF
jgi:hypothetical protein